ncbi:uncharacterized protein LOC131155817 isoform X2 [Malania oleifera]|uniref:uncharacterized protein LOC131155817 isoform X2 n=1 Tax=Malania oleifera TaxID=397392 RepID=UPI0025AE79CD|nr:uncharacterized protein LOC131155817 isoform X2 [Malania oleifera]
MEEYYKRSHIPAFGSWDCSDDMPFTECFESAKQAGLLRYSYSEDRDLYVARDFYDNDVMTPAMIVVPRRRIKGRYPHVKEVEKQGWAGDVMKEPPSPFPQRRPAPKAVDEDLYKIPPELLHQRPRKKTVLGFLASCLLPTCVL